MVNRLFVNDTEVVGVSGLSIIVGGYDPSQMANQSTASTEIEIPYLENLNALDAYGGEGLTSEFAKKAHPAKVIMDGYEEAGEVRVTEIDKEANIARLTFYGTASSYIGTIKGESLRITDLFASEHELVSSNVANRMFIDEATGDDGVFYPLVNWGGITEAVLPDNATPLEPMKRSTVLYGFDFFPVAKVKTILNNLYSQAGVAYVGEAFNDPVLNSLAITHEDNYKAKTSELSIRMPITANDRQEPQQSNRGTVYSWGTFPSCQDTDYPGVIFESFNYIPFVLGTPPQPVSWPNPNVGFFLPFLIDSARVDQHGFDEPWGWELTKTGRDLSGAFIANTKSFKVRARIKGQVTCYIGQSRAKNTQLLLRVGVSTKATNAASFVVADEYVQEVGQMELGAPSSVRGESVSPYYRVVYDIDMAIDVDLDIYNTTDDIFADNINLVYDLRPALDIDFALEPDDRLYLTLDDDVSFWELIRSTDEPYHRCTIDPAQNLPDLAIGDLLDHLAKFYGLVEHTFGNVVKHRLIKDILRDFDNAEDWSQRVVFETDSVRINDALSNYGQQTLIGYEDADADGQPFFFNTASGGSFSLDASVLPKETDYYTAPFAPTFMGVGYGLEMAVIKNLTRPENYNPLSDGNAGTTFDSITPRIAQAVRIDPKAYLQRDYVVMTFPTEATLKDLDDTYAYSLIFTKPTNPKSFFAQFPQSLTIEDAGAGAYSNDPDNLPDVGLKSAYLQEVIAMINKAEVIRPKVKLTAADIQNGCLTLKYIEGRGYYFLGQLEQFDPTRNETYATLWRVK